MSAPLDPKTVCHRCGASGNATDKFCRQCGAAMAAAPQVAQGDDAAGVGPPIAVAVGRAAATEERPRWSESPWVILPLLFLLLGPLAFGILWRSRRFSRPWKIILTLIVTGITVWVCWQLWLLFQQVWAWAHELEKAQAQGGF
jgi:hypothetical protein